MSLHIFLAVLLAALLHASWNLLVKINLDRFLSIFLLQIVMGLAALIMLAVFPRASLACLPYAIASGILHSGYNVFLARSYRTGDLSQVYPIARGTAPLLTFAGAWIFAGESVALAAGFGIVLLVAGIWATSMAGKRTLKLDGATLFFALGTSVFIAAYTVVDGLGGRASGSASSYAALVFVFDALIMMMIGVVMRGPGIFAAVLPAWKNGLVGGLLSLGAYWIVIWAMTQAPIAAVAALRESSILFVMGMSVVVLKERVTHWRIGGALLIVAGAILLRIS
ncbi:EamA family transporter [soil metagenome]